MRTSSPYNSDLFKFKKAEDAFENAKFRNLAIENHLYIETWTLINYLTREFSAEDDIISMCFYDNIPIGMCIRMNYGLTMFYVKEEFRRMGIATKLLECFDRTKGQFAYHGINGSEIFFERVGLVMRENI